MNENHIGSLLFLNSQNGCQVIQSSYISDDRKSLTITFLAISDQYANFIFTKGQYAMADGHFGSTIWAILDDRKSLSIAFQINTQLLFSQNGNKQLLLFFFMIWLLSGHFGLPKITFNCISRHFRSIRFFSPAAILDY